MRIRNFAVAAALAAAPPAAGQLVGGPLADLQPTGFANTAATRLADFSGRLLLVEYFAYW